MKTVLVGNSCINRISRLARDWQRWAVTRVNSVVNFLVSCLSVSSFISGRDCRNLSTVPTSQIAEYLGSEGFSSKMLFRNRVSNGCSPKVVDCPRVMTDDKAERAVLIAL